VSSTRLLLVAYINPLSSSDVSGTHRASLPALKLACNYGKGPIFMYNERIEDLFHLREKPVSINYPENFISRAPRKLEGSGCSSGAQWLVC
jgi:hypothetical protein